MKIEAILLGSTPCRTSVHMTKPLQTAVDLMRADATDAVVVTDHCATEGEAVFGLLTRQDVDDALAAHGAAALRMPIGKVAKGRFVVCDKGSLLADVISMMERNAAPHTLVMDREQLVGLLAGPDIVAFAHAPAEMSKAH